MAEPDDLFHSILGELAAPAPVERPRIEIVRESPEVREARARASMAVVLGQEMGLGRALNDGEMEVALKIQARQRAAAAKTQMLGGGGNQSRIIVDDDGVGLGQLENIRAPSRYIDEVDKYLIDKNKAAQASGGSEFHTFVEMKEAQQAELAKQPAIGINPPTAGESPLGQTLLVDTGAPPVIAAYWNADDAHTMPITAILAPAMPFSFTTTKPNTMPARPYGIVQFGTRGCLTQAEVDIGRGTQFVVSGSMVTLQLALPPVVGNNAAIKMLLTGMLSFRAGRRTTAVTRTLYIDGTIANGSPSAVLQIPSFAKDVILTREVLGGAQTLLLLDSTGDTILTFDLAANTVMTTPIVLPGDAVFAQVVWKADPTSAFTHLVFGLTF